MDPLVRARGLRGYPALMRELGHDPAALLSRYRIEEAAFDQDDALISLRSSAHLLEASAMATGCGDFGLRLSLRQTIDLLGPISVMAQNAPTIRDALTDLVRYLFVHTSGIVISMNDRQPLIEDTVEISIDIRLSGRVTLRQSSDLCLADAHNYLRLFAGGDYDLRAVSIPHDPIASRATYERFFGARLLEEPSRATLHVARSVLAAKVQGANATLRQIAEDYVYRNFLTTHRNTSDRVRQVLRQTLGTSACDKSSIAALLAMHPRTLQRRLADENTGFETLKDEVRRELLEHYLHNTRLTLGQISLMLGFPAQSALSRACRQWFGQTPSAMRAPANLAGTR